MNAPMFYRTLFPSRPLLSFPSLNITIMQSRATGITDHLLPLGNRFDNISPANSQKLFPITNPDSVVTICARANQKKFMASEAFSHCT